MTRPSRLRAYGQNIPFIDVFPFPIYKTNSPGATDTEFEVGQVWIYNASSSSREAYIFGGLDSNGAAIWIIANPGSSEVNALQPDFGDSPVHPGTGVIKLYGTENEIVTTGDNFTNTITFSLDSNVHIVNTLTVPSIIGSDVGNLGINLGDNAGSNFLAILDSDASVVASINSNGKGTFVDLTTSGTTQNIGNSNSATTVSIAGGTGGNTVNINSGNNTSDNIVNICTGSPSDRSYVNILSGTSISGFQTLNLNTGVGVGSRVTNIGTGAVHNVIIIGGTGANTINIGNTQTTGTVSIGSDMTTGTISIGGTGAQTGTITLSASTAAQTLDIANLDGAKTINIGNGVSGNQIAIGNGINTSAQTISIANGNSAANSTVNILSGNGASGTGILNLANNPNVTQINIGASTSLVARTLSIMTGDQDQSQTINILDGVYTGGEQIVNILSTEALGAAQILNLGVVSAICNIKGFIQINDSTNTDVKILTGTADASLFIGNSLANQITIDTGENISIDAAFASNFTVTGTAEDLTLSSIGGSVNIIGSQGVSDAIVIQASDSAGGIDLIAGTGGVEVTGNLILASVATQLRMNGGAATDFIGTGTLSSGTLTIGNTNIASTDQIYIQRIGINSSTALGDIIYTINAGTNFVITSVQRANPSSTETNDNSTFSYVIIRQI